MHYNVVLLTMDGIDMLKNRIKCIFLTAVVCLIAVSASAEKLRLSREGDLEQLTQKPQDQYLLEVSRIKQLVIEGDCGAVAKAVSQLKQDFPAITGRDLEAFMIAEELFCKGDLSKAFKSYERFLDRFPESGLYQAALHREFAIGTAYLAGHKKTVLGLFRIKGYAEGQKIMEKILDRVGNAPMGIKAAYAMAENYEKREKFEDAYLKWSEIHTRWPAGEVGRESLLNMARTKHAAYNGPKYSASHLISAKTYYETYLQRYPEHAGKLEVEKILVQIKEQLAYKHLDIGLYYERTKSMESAKYYYQLILDQWPETKAAEIAKQLMK